MVAPEVDTGHAKRSVVQTRIPSESEDRQTYSDTKDWTALEAKAARAVSSAGTH